MRFVNQTINLASVLADKLTSALSSNDRVVWLIPGGSNIAISVAAMQQINEELSRKLVIMQTDERYVPLNDPDCNWRQLREAGLDTKQATSYPVLLDDNETLPDVANRYARTVEEQFAAADYIIGQFGIGADGHTAGIKPNSPATRSKQLVSGYEAEDFERITLTFTALARLSAAYTFAHGVDKKPVIDQLQSGGLPLETLPAGALKLVPESVLYSDQT